MRHLVFTSDNHHHDGADTVDKVDESNGDTSGVILICRHESVNYRYHGKATRADISELSGLGNGALRCAG